MNSGSSAIYIILYNLKLVNKSILVSLVTFHGACYNIIIVSKEIVAYLKFQ